jgi:thioredoxin 1
MVNLTEDIFNEEVVQSPGVVVIDFWANWCSPCRAFAPTFAKLAGAMPEVKFAKVDVSECHELAKSYSIDAIPATLIFKEGKLAQKLVGMLSESQLKNAIENHIG